MVHWSKPIIGTLNLILRDGMRGEIIEVPQFSAYRQNRSRNIGLTTSWKATVLKSLEKCHQLVGGGTFRWVSVSAPIVNLTKGFIHTLWQAQLLAFGHRKNNLGDHHASVGNFSHRHLIEKHSNGVDVCLFAQAFVLELDQLRRHMGYSTQLRSQELCDSFFQDACQAKVADFTHLGKNWGKPGTKS